MRILVFSDSHGNISEMLNVMANERYDMLMHAGDYGEDLARAAKSAGVSVPQIAVRGNCDPDSAYPREVMTEAEGVKILTVHGNRQAVKTSVNRLYYYALEQGADIVVFGHTHAPMVKNTGDLFILNPGTIAVPHGYGKSYGIIEIGENPRRKIDIRTVLVGR